MSDRPDSRIEDDPAPEVAGEPVRTPLRWRLADEETNASLFPDETAMERHVGTGEFRGMEFLHVNARSIINSVPASSRMPFRYTINPYRGCSHACSYCMSGDTPILMGDGRVKRLAQVRPGDVVYGTVRDGNYRRYVLTEVLDHWSTVKRAFRTTLEDGTELITSGDHRFLTERGWRHVNGSMSGANERPYLTTNDSLVGTGHFADPAELGADYQRGYLTGMVHGDRKMAISGTALKSDARLRVLKVESLGVDLAMYDITTGTGDFIANGVVSHNCFARPTHDYLGLNIGEDFERRIVVKVNAVERLRAELRSRKWQGDHIAMGTNTDPYQHAEGKYHLTQGIIKTLGEFRNPFSILTKSTLILRDLRRLEEAAAKTTVRCNVSIGTLDREVWKLTEPGTPPPDRRLEVVRRLNAAGIPCGVLVAPIIPGLSDTEEQIRHVVEQCLDAGAVSISAVGLHLRPGVREHFMGWLGRTRPDLVPTYRQRFNRGSYQPKAEQDRIASILREAMLSVPSRVVDGYDTRGVGKSPRREPDVRTTAGPADVADSATPSATAATAEQLRLL